jgi:hypothetical protein
MSVNFKSAVNSPLEQSVEPFSNYSFYVQLGKCSDNRKRAYARLYCRHSHFFSFLTKTQITKF